MKANDKIYISEYLKQLNEHVKNAITYRNLNPDYVELITCKELAERCGVTAATISNLTTNSRFYLLWRVAEEILDAYYGFFAWSEALERKENPDTIFYPKDKVYVLMCLTTYYTDEWLHS